MAKRPGPGGKRAGAGRRPLGDSALSVARTLKLTPAELAAQQVAATRAGTTWSAWARVQLGLALRRLSVDGTIE